MWDHKPEEKEAGARKKVAVFHKGAPYQRPPVEIVDIPFENTAMPGYLRLGTREPGPCVILLPGSDSSKEQHDFFLHYVKFDSESAEVRDGSTRRSVARRDMIYAESVEELRSGTFSRSKLKRCDKIAVYDRGGRILFYVSDSQRARDYLKNELKLLFFQRSNT
jgi:hypothetical protein